MIAIAGNVPGPHSGDMIFPDNPASAEDVATHYNELDLAYRLVWGEHVHHGYWQTGRESPGEAADALVALVARHLAPNAGQRLCDIGCGYGATAASLADRHGVSVTGFTLSQNQASIARTRGANIECIVRDWLDNELPDEHFDNAYAIESTEHMADKAGFFSEACRVLKPGGRLVVCAWLQGENVRDWEARHLLRKICSEGQLPSMGSRADYESLAGTAGFHLRSYEDISRNVRPTWSICLRRLLAKMATDKRIRRLALSPATRNRSFILSVPRLIVALRTGAMRYGVFVWEKGVPQADPTAATAARSDAI